MKNLAFRVCKITEDGSKDCNWASAFRPGLLKDGEFIEVAENDNDFIPIEEWDNQKGDK